jgi:hypothetical protein
MVFPELMSVNELSLHQHHTVPCSVFFIMFSMGMLSTATVLNRGLFLAYQFLILWKVIQHPNAVGVLLINLVCIVCTHRISSFLLFLQSIAILVHLPSTVELRTLTLGFLTFMVLSWVFQGDCLTLIFGIVSIYFGIADLTSHAIVNK